MSDQKFGILDLDAAAAASARINTICHAVMAGMNGFDRVTMKGDDHALVCEAMDAIAKCLRIMATPTVVDRNERPAAVDLAIPSELAHVFSFVGGRSDGVLFVMSPRPNMMQLRIQPTETSEVFLFTQPMPVRANTLLQLELKDPR